MLIQKQKNMNEDVTTSFLRNLLSNVGDSISQEQIITIAFELLNKLLNASKLEYGMAGNMRLRLLKLMRLLGY
jgi:hypothetical protein